MRSQLTLLAALGSVAVSLCALTSSNLTLAASSEKTLNFPASQSVGWIIDVTQDPGLECNIHGNRLCKSQGTVKVSRSKHLKFEPNSHFFEQPECLLKLPSDAFDYIELRFLSMADNEENISDKVIAYVTHLKGLKVVSLDKSETTDAAAAKLAFLPNLTSLSATDSLVRGKCLDELRKCKSIRFLRFGNGEIDHSSLQFLAQFPNLKRLSLRRAGLKKTDIEQVSKCTSLVNLAISQNPALDDSCVALITKLKNLTDLELAETAVSSAGLEKLSVLKNLNVSLPKPTAAYSQKERIRFKQLFPQAKFNRESLVEKKRERDINDFLDTTNPADSNRK
jgi:hypothetical protein